MEEQKPQRRIDKKTAIAGAFAVFLLMGLVYAAYTVLTTTITVPVEEAFEVKYAIPSDPSQYCSSLSEYYQMPETDTIELRQMYPGETVKVCFKIYNNSSASLPYDIVLNYNAQNLTVEKTVNSPVTGKSDSYAAVKVTVNSDATPGSYDITANVTRG